MNIQCEQTELLTSLSSALGLNGERLDVFVGFLSFHCIPAETIEPHSTHAISFSNRQTHKRTAKARVLIHALMSENGSNGMPIDTNNPWPALMPQRDTVCNQKEKPLLGFAPSGNY